LGRKQVRTELLVTTEDKLMTITTPARPAPSTDDDDVETTGALFDAAAKPVLRATWQRDPDGALVCRWVPGRTTPTHGRSRT
jgi:hypothetical protein